ncbi:hypothetical protein [Sphingobium sp. YG1]|jgi:hypothetical protein|uniref:hypothetical protein n=1 Tax=Sphingobium sp. YG1 TaxID=2082188 RepID=UPI001559DDD0
MHREFMRALSMTFDGQMLQFMDGDEAVTDDSRIDARATDNTDDRGMGVRTDAPDMEIGNARVSSSFDKILYFLGDMIVSRIEKRA